MAEEFSWRQTFQSFGLIGIIYSTVLIFFLKEKRETEIAEDIAKEKSSVFKGLGVLFVNISFWIILFYFAIPSLPGWGVKNWLPTLFAENLNIDMSKAGPLSTITIAASSFIGVIFGGILSDRWVQKISVAESIQVPLAPATIPALLFIGFGHSLFAGYWFSILFWFWLWYVRCQQYADPLPVCFKKYRATAYGLMNMVGVFAGAFITDLLGKSTDAGNLGKDFAMLAGIVAVALIIQLVFLKPKAVEFNE
ncbi:MAG: MFS transporter [Saprospiraceae bacterium]|nr:MFS transporter [Saprospiraceae bacterium]